MPDAVRREVAETIRRAFRALSESREAGHPFDVQTEEAVKAVQRTWLKKSLSEIEEIVDGIRKYDLWLLTIKTLSWMFLSGFALTIIFLLAIGGLNLLTVTFFILFTLKTLFPIYLWAIAQFLPISTYCEKRLRPLMASKVWKSLSGLGGLFVAVLVSFLLLVFEVRRWEKPDVMLPFAYILWGVVGWIGVRRAISLRREVRRYSEQEMNVDLWA